MIDIDTGSFLVVTVAAALAAFIASVVSTRVPLPVVVVEILFGICLGPELLDLAQPDPFLEFFAMGDSVPRALTRADEVTNAALALPPSRVRFGLQPHAPYSVAPAGYRHALARAGRDHLPIATHLAESIEEREFIGAAKGPQRRLLEALGLWNDSLLADFGQGKTPVAHLASILRERSTPILLVHLNDVSDADIDLLIELNADVPIHLAYCPRSSEFFIGTFGPLGGGWGGKRNEDGVHRRWCVADNQHRTGRRGDKRLTDAPKEDTKKCAVAARARDDKIRSNFVDQRDQRGDW